MYHNLRKKPVGEKVGPAVGLSVGASTVWHKNRERLNRQSACIVTRNNVPVGVDEGEAVGNSVGESVPPKLGDCFRGWLT